MFIESKLAKYMTPKRVYYLARLFGEIQCLQDMLWNTIDHMDEPEVCWEIQRRYVKLNSQLKWERK